MVAGTWLGAFGTLIPTWRGKWGAFGLDKTIGSCTILRDRDSKYFANLFDSTLFQNKLSNLKE